MAPKTTSRDPGPWPRLFLKRAPFSLIAEHAILMNYSPKRMGILFVNTGGGAPRNFHPRGSFYSEISCSLIRLRFSSCKKQFVPCPPVGVNSYRIESSNFPIFEFFQRFGSSAIQDI